MVFKPFLLLFWLFFCAGRAEALLLSLWAQYMCLWTICVWLHICGPSIFAHGNTLVDLAPKWQEHHSVGVFPSPSPTYLHYIVFSYLSKKTCRILNCGFQFSLSNEELHNIVLKEIHNLSVPVMKISKRFYSSPKNLDTQNRTQVLILMELIVRINFQFYLLLHLVLKLNLKRFMLKV